LEVVDIIRILVDYPSLHGFQPAPGDLMEEGKAVIPYRNHTSGEVLDLVVQDAGSHFRFTANIPKGSAMDPSVLVKEVFKENRHAFLAGLAMDSNGSVWSEAALLKCQIEPNEAIDAIRSVIAVWLKGRDLIDG
jgi:hypothetical protein